jgi:hypothetical protein
MRLIPFAAALLLAVPAWPQDAEPAALPAWEYATATGSPYTIYRTSNNSSWLSYAAICYPATRGCKYEYVYEPVAYQTLGAEALMIAANNLGEQGWELTSVTETSINTEIVRTMTFRRPRAKP